MPVARDPEASARRVCDASPAPGEHGRDPAPPVEMALPDLPADDGPEEREERRVLGGQAAPSLDLAPVHVV
jgi:hypothetical protein